MTEGSLLKQGRKKSFTNQT